MDQDDRHVRTVLRHWNLHEDLLQSWAILREGLERRMAQAGSFRGLAMALRRLWYRR